MEIQRARASLGNMPKQANRLIHFLNTHTREQLAALEIVDRTCTILIVKKVLSMRNFIQNLERKCLHREVYSLAAEGSTQFINQQSKTVNT